MRVGALFQIAVPVVAALFVIGIVPVAALIVISKERAVSGSIPAASREGFLI